MEIDILDVAHGFCAVVIADNGNNMLIDCGHNEQTGMCPSAYLLARGCVGVNRFFPLNYDEDHLSGLPSLLAVATRLPIHILHRNTSITPDQLRRMKAEKGPLGPGVTALLWMLHAYQGPVLAPPVYPNVEFAAFHNDYPAFRDTNNLSQVLFVHAPGVSIVFPGDIETAGWRALLGRPEFIKHLVRVNVFVASHHGRISGYAPEVFNVCHPDIIIISDDVKQYDTQECDYSRHAIGIVWNQTAIRRVLTTRNDGRLMIQPNGGGYVISASRN